MIKVIICAIAIAYSMGQIINSVCRACLLVLGLRGYRVQSDMPSVWLLTLYCAPRWVKKLGWSVDHGQKGRNLRWRPRWPPCHKIIHNLSRKRAREIILVSLHRFGGLKNLMKPCIWLSPYLGTVKSNIAAIRGPWHWTSCNFLSTLSRVTNLVSLPRLPE